MTLGRGRRRRKSTLFLQDELNELEKESKSFREKIAISDYLLNIKTPTGKQKKEWNKAIGEISTIIKGIDKRVEEK